MLSEGMADRIIGLYALGTSTRDISSWLEETVGTSVSAETISSITDRVLPELEAWRNRSLDEVYPIVWLYALHYKVMDEKNRVVSRAIYNVLGIDKDGHKDLLGMYVSKNKGVFPNDTALIKLVYLAYRNARKKWTMPVPNWGIISQQLAIKFEDRYNLL